MNLTLWNPEAQRAERRMGTMRKYPGCSPIARPSRSNVFFNQSSMKVALHRSLILIPAKHPRPSVTTLTVENHSVASPRPSHGPSLRQTGAWRRAARAFARAAGPALSLSGGATTATTGLTLGRPGMPTPRYVSRTTDLVLGIPEAPNHPRSLAPGQCNSSHCESPFKTTG